MPVCHFLEHYSLDKENRLWDFDFVFPIECFWEMFAPQKYKDETNT